MARKSKSCRKSMLETVAGRLRIRVCVLTRQHSGRCWDTHGAFGGDS